MGKWGFASGPSYLLNTYHFQAEPGLLPTLSTCHSSWGLCLAAAAQLLLPGAGKAYVGSNASWEQPSNEVWRELVDCQLSCPLGRKTETLSILAPGSLYGMKLPSPMVVTCLMVHLFWLAFLSSLTSPLAYNYLLGSLFIQINYFHSDQSILLEPKRRQDPLEVPLMQVYWWQIPFLLIKNTFTSFLFLDNGFAGYTIPGCQLFSLKLWRYYFTVYCHSNYCSFVGDLPFLSEKRYLLCFWCSADFIMIQLGLEF